MVDLLKRLPSDFPISYRPYKEIAEKIGIEESQLIERLKELKEKGIIRRIAAIIYHRNFYLHNLMVVFKIKGDIEEKAKKIASFPQVSHLYERDGGGYWQYTLYAMIHAKTEKECREVLKRIVEETGLEDFKVFPSKKEFKKIGFSVS